uniref:Uncharacterized protein n=1 Tax=Cacopsylla melanoneura TaxID=428564 RepID=A0A8D8WFB7_9HEMI
MTLHDIKRCLPLFVPCVHLRFRASYQTAHALHGTEFGRKVERGFVQGLVRGVQIEVQEDVRPLNISMRSRWAIIQQRGECGVAYCFQKKVGHGGVKGFGAHVKGVLTTAFM